LLPLHEIYNWNGRREQRGMARNRRRGRKMKLNMVETLRVIRLTRKRVKASPLEYLAKNKARREAQKRARIAFTEVAIIDRTLKRTQRNTHEIFNFL